MRATLLIACLTLLPGLARADLGDARRILAASCTRCHTALPGGAGAKSPDGAPDLVALVKQKSSAEILAWLQGPSHVNPETRCDVSGLDLRFANDLVNYLVGLTVVPPARRTPERR